MLHDRNLFSTCCIQSLFTKLRKNHLYKQVSYQSCNKKDKMSPITIIGNSQRVVDAPGLTIDELAGKFLE